MLSNKSCVLKMAQMLVNFNDQKMSGRPMQPWRRPTRLLTGVVTTLKACIRNLTSCQVVPKQAGFGCSKGRSPQGTDTRPPLLASTAAGGQDSVGGCDLYFRTGMK